MKPSTHNKFRRRNAFRAIGIQIHGNSIIFLSQNLLPPRTYSHVETPRGISLITHREKNTNSNMECKDRRPMEKIVRSLCKQGQLKKAVDILYEMKQHGVRVEKHSYGCILQLCIDKKNLMEGRRVQSLMNESGFKVHCYVMNRLIDLYAKCGKLKDARQLFDKMEKRDVFSWNTMIAGYVKERRVDEARKLFYEMPNRDRVSWNSMIAEYARRGEGEEAVKLSLEMHRAGVRFDGFTFVSVLSACSTLMDLQLGKQVHGHSVRTGFQENVYLQNTLLDVYAKCGSMDDARQVFDKIPERNVVSWNALIAGYVQGGYGEETSALFHRMERENLELDQVTLGIFISACLRFGNVCDARHVFDKMTEKDDVSWTAMITGYAHNGYGEEALHLFKEMLLAGIKPDAVTYASVLCSCAELACLVCGEDVHAHIIRSGFEVDVLVGSVLLDMYAKCGNIENALHVFNRMQIRNLVSWNSIILGCSLNGLPGQAIDFFEHMVHAGIKPNHITFVGVFSACRYAGLVDEGRRYFNSMSISYGVTPRAENFSCMVDLLARSGCLEEAEDFINNLPVEPDGMMWESLLAGCRIHKNMEIGKRVAETLMELKPQYPGPYVTLLDIYAAAGRWDDVSTIKTLMQERGVRKTPGYSWIVVNKKVHKFIAEDRSHAQWEKSYAALEMLAEKMKKAGYVDNTNFVLCNVSVQGKESSIGYHSEKLAIAFGIINMPSGTPIRVIKNLRVCGNCHTAIKFISKIIGREIIVRDANLFHYFRDGFCSCGDYW